MHNAGCSSMCGHGIIAVTKSRIWRSDWLQPRSATVTGHPGSKPRQDLVNSTFDSRTPVGTAFDNVPSFALVQNHVFEVPGLGQVICDLAFGGAFYVYLDAESIGLSLKMENSLEIVAMGRQIKQAVSDQLRVKHPVHDDLSFLYGTIFVAPANHAESQFRNVCVFADGELDRSPTGTGVSGLAAILVAKGQLPLNRPIQIESIIGTKFQVEAVDKTKFCGLDAIVPRVAGTAYITGRHQFLVDPDDPLKHGFLIR